MVNGFPSFSRISRVKNPHSQNSVPFLLFSRIFALHLKELNNVSFAVLKIGVISYNWLCILRMHCWLQIIKADAKIQKTASIN